MIGDHLFWGYLFPLLVIIVLSIIIRTCFVWHVSTEDTYYNKPLPKIFFIIFIILGLIPFLNYAIAIAMVIPFVILWSSEGIILKPSKKQSKLMKWLME